MCLISSCPKGTEKSSQEVMDFIESGMNCNSDGSGFMYKRNGTNEIVVKKGYFAVSLLKQAIIDANLTIDDELVIHHRIGTSGNVTNTNCHPFIISDVAEETIRTDYTTNKPCMVHNGIFRYLHSYMQLNPHLSDTYAFSRYIMPDLLGLLENNKKLFTILTDRIIGTDKICILHPHKDLEMLGNFIEKNGYFHSNNGYCRMVRDFGGSSTAYRRNMHEDYENFMNNDWDNGNFVHTVRDNKKNNLPITNNEKKLIVTENTEATIKSLFPIIKLSKYQITLNNDNANHFIFALKSEYDLNASNCYYFEIDNFNKNIYYQNVKTINNKKFDSIRTDNLIDNYYYIPKGEYADVYTDYLFLNRNNFIRTKTACKKHKKILASNYKRGDNDCIKLKGIREIKKLALKLYIDYIEPIVLEARIVL